MKKCEEIVVGWVPDRGFFKTYPACGRVIVYVPPEIAETSQYTHTIGANTDGWVESGVTGRQKWMQKVVTGMLYEDNIKLDVLRQALCQVDEWREFPFSTERPTPEDAG